jgi:hypothetical protein
MPEGVIRDEDRAVLDNPDGLSLERVIRVLCRSALRLERAIIKDREELARLTQQYPIRAGHTIEGDRS